MTLRYDSSPLGKAQVTPQGGLRIPATLTRTGVFRYLQPDGSFRAEYRSPEEVFHPDALATLAGAPVTVLHPDHAVKPGYVTTEDWRHLAVGHLGDEAQRAEDGIHVEGRVYVMDSETLAGIERGDWPEISMGYDQTYVAGPGTAPDGTPYDGRQTMLRFNHAALVPRGRMGRSVGLRLDSLGHEINPHTEPRKTMDEITIAGKTYKVGSPEATAALASLTERAARADAAEPELARLKAERRARIAKIAAKNGVEVRQDADEAALMASTLAKLIPGFSVDGQSPDYIMGAFAAAIEMLMSDDKADDGAKPGETPPGEQNPDAPGAPGAAGATAVRQDAIDSREHNTAGRLAAVDEGPAAAARAKMIQRGNRAIRPE